MSSIRSFILAATAFAMLTVPTSSASAQGQLNIYCSVQVEWCQAIATNFRRETGIAVNMTQKGSGETLAQIRAEAQNPRGDIWFGGTGDPHLILAEEGLSVEYKPTALNELQPWALKQYDSAKGRSIGIYSGALGFGFNSELLAQKKIPAPASITRSSSSHLGRRPCSFRGTPIFWGRTAPPLRSPAAAIW